jgi:hypothetical protein
MAVSRSRAKPPRRGYDALKTFAGKRYTGMAIGRGHTWRYDQGEWKEKKVSPERWEFSYTVTKRRKGHAPEGSGAPVGTEYHWYILAHQVVRKLNANDYSTAMTGIKFKLAHKRADKEAWSLDDPRQRRQVIRLLEDQLQRLRMEEPDPATPVASGTGHGRSGSLTGGRGRT